MVCMAASTKSELIDVVGPSNIMRSRQFDNQQSINWYPMYDVTRNKWCQYPYAGNDVVNTFSTENPDAIGRPGGTINIGANALMIVGDEVFLIASNFSSSSVGTIGTNSGPVSMCAG